MSWLIETAFFGAVFFVIGCALYLFLVAGSVFINKSTYVPVNGEIEVIFVFQFQETSSVQGMINQSPA